MNIPQLSDTQFINLMTKDGDTERQWEEIGPDSSKDYFSQPPGQNYKFGPIYRIPFSSPEDVAAVGAYLDFRLERDSRGMKPTHAYGIDGADGGSLVISRHDLCEVGLERSISLNLKNKDHQVTPQGGNAELTQTK